MSQHSQRGMTIVELSLALALATLSFGALFTLLHTTTRIMDSNRHELEAMLAAESAIEQLRSASWSDITNKPEHATMDGNGIVDIAPLPGFGTALAPRHVTVRMPWSDKGGHSNVCALTTLISPWSRPQ